ncbi:MAG: hypothetical protein Kow0037_21330 [Calditrichia bacterium]
MQFFEGATYYHENSGYSFEKVKTLYREFANEPAPPSVKEFPGRPKIPLTISEALRTDNLENSLTIASRFQTFRKISDEPIEAQKLVDLLYLTNGVTLEKDLTNRKLFFRAAPSASALYPTDIYLLVKNVNGLEPGLYYFNPEAKQLVSINSSVDLGKFRNSTFNLALLNDAPALLVLAGNLPRVAWKFESRAYRYCLQDAGYVLQNLLVGAASLGLACNYTGDFADDQLNELLGLDGNDEFSLVLAAVGKDRGEASEEKYQFGMQRDEIPTGTHGNLNHFMHRISRHYLPSENLLNVEVKLPYHHRQEQTAAEPKNKLSLLNELLPLRTATHEIIRKRRSNHSFLRSVISINELSQILRRLSLSPTLYGYNAQHIYLAANDVDGLAPGLYRYHPPQHSLRDIRTGAFRGDLSYLTIAQDAVFNCSVALFFAVDFSDYAFFANRGYRYAHINTGMLGETAYLVATELGVGVRGIGNYFDSSLNTFFKLPEGREYILGGIILGK